MQAGFLKRVCAYIIDIILLNAIISLITINMNINNKYNEEIVELTNKYTNKEIVYDDMLKEYNKLVYNSQKDNYIYYIVELIITVGYFIVFQTLNKGQTIGKKLLRIKIVNNDNSDINIKGIILRSLFIYNILSLSTICFTIKLLSMHAYNSTYTIVTTCETLFTIITFIFIMYKKEKRGLHDIIANTKVISI